MTSWTEAEITALLMLAQQEPPAPAATGTQPAASGLPEMVGDTAATQQQPGNTNVPITPIHQTNAPTQGSWYVLALPVILIGFIVMTQVFAGKRERKQREAMYATLAKGDRVQTLGGIIGTITELGDHEVVVKTEDSRVRFSKSAVQQVLKSSAPVAGSESGGGHSAVEVKSRASKAAV